VIKPLYLLADSQLLFWKDGNRLFLERIREQLDSSNPTVAYIGASNGDNPEFYSIFQAAMAGIDLHSCCLIPSSPSEKDKAFLASANLVLLAGGDVEHGWKVFEQNGFKDLIAQKRYDGAVLVGISAGAAQIGRGTLLQAATMKELPLFQLAPFYVGAHQEQSEWWDLRALVNLAGNGARGLGIPAGGGMIYTSEGSLEPIRKGLIEFLRHEDKLIENLLLPETATNSSEGLG